MPSLSEGKGPALTVAWLPGSALDVDWEESFVDAIHRVRARGVVVEEGQHPDVDVTIFAYRASEHDADRVRESLIDTCATQRSTPPSRIAVVACGWSDKTVTQAMVDEVMPQASLGYHRHSYRALHCPELRDEAEKWMLVSARVPPSMNVGDSLDYSAEAVIERDTHSGKGLWWTGLS